MKFDPGRSLLKDPYLSFRFRLKIEGKVVAGFNEVKGLTAETQVETFREGGRNTFEHQLVGPTKYPEKLVLKRGLSDDVLWLWYKDVMAGRLARTDLTVNLLDYDGTEVPAWTWVFQKACPVKWNGPQLQAGTAGVAFETIELIHQGL